MAEMVLVEPKAWRVKAFDKQYGADVSVVCGSCGEAFERTVPPVAHPVAICKWCRGKNELHTNFADHVDYGWHPA